MKSIYEEITHVYLRLNGFFISPNYVVEGERSNEIDILAYRPRGAKEYIEEHEALPVDNNLFTTIKRILEESTGRTINEYIKETYDIAAIVEVKGKNSQPWPTNNEERTKRIIRYSLNLFGTCCGEKQVQNLLEKGITIVTHRKNLIILLMGFRLCNRHLINYNGKYLEICIEKALDFIIDRIHRFKEFKTTNRVHYPYTTFQLLILLDKIYNITEKL